MTQTSPVETVLDRRQLRRKLTRWRLAAAGLAVVAVLVAVGRFGGEAGRLTSHIARVQISGLITGDRGTLKLLKSIEDFERRGRGCGGLEPRRHGHGLRAYL